MEEKEYENTSNVAWRFAMKVLEGKYGMPPNLDTVVKEMLEKVHPAELDMAKERLYAELRIAAAGTEAPPEENKDKKDATRNGISEPGLDSVNIATEQDDKQSILNHAAELLTGEISLKELREELESQDLPNKDEYIEKYIEDVLSQMAEIIVQKATNKDQELDQTELKKRGFETKDIKFLKEQIGLKKQEALAKAEKEGVKDDKKEDRKEKKRADRQEGQNPKEEQSWVDYVLKHRVGRNGNVTIGESLIRPPSRGNHNPTQRDFSRYHREQALKKMVKIMLQQGIELDEQALQDLTKRGIAKEDTLFLKQEFERQKQKTGNKESSKKDQSWQNVASEAKKKAKKPWTQTTEEQESGKDIGRTR